MDEIDNAVDNLFGQYITKTKDVAAVPTVPLPGNGPELDASTQAASHPDIIAKPSGPHPDIIRKQAVSQPKPNVSVKAATKSQKTVATKKSVKKSSATNIAVPVDIAEIKKQTATMLRHLHKAIKSENWWHKLYYANKFLLIASNLSRTVTRREKQA